MVWTFDVIAICGIVAIGLAVVLPVVSVFARKFLRRR